MGKKIVKEIIIMLLISLAILLVLSVLLYGFIPSNKVIPTVTEYQASEEIRQELQQAAQEDTSQIVLSYEVTSNDLSNYQKAKSYKAGKVNPFAAYGEETNQSTSTSSNNNNASGNTTSNTSNNTIDNNNSNNASNNTTNNNNSSNNSNTNTNDNTENTTNDINANTTSTGTTNENTGKFFETTPGK